MAVVDISVQVAPRALAGALCLLALGCGSLSPGPTGQWTYRFAVDEALRTATVSACAPGRGADLEAPEAEFIADIKRAGDCVHYTVDLLPASVASGRADVAIYVLPDLVVQPRQWLARPAALPEGVTAEVELVLPPGVRAFVPWRSVGPNRYAIDWTTFRLDGRMVLTRQTPRQLRVEQTEIQALTLGRQLEAPAPAFDAWITDAVRGVAQIYGGFPARRLQILLIGSPGDEVGFGMVARGGGPAALIYVGHEVSAGSLAADWTMTHELFHLGMPRVERGDEWLSEGITSYYTYVARARAGVIDASEAWSKLHDGFVRGRGARTGRSLLEESKAMPRTGAYWAVYWGGAAWAAAADLKLRQAGHSLDEVMRFWLGLGDTAQWYSAATLLARADESFPGVGLAALAETFLAAEPLPEEQLKPLYRALGLAPIDDQRVRLVEGPAAKLRDAITPGSVTPAK